MPDLITWLRIGMAFSLFWQAGILFLNLVRARGLYWVEWICLGFGLGVGLIAFEMLLLSFVGVRFNLLMICTPWAVAWAVYLVKAAPWRARRSPPLANPARVLRFSPGHISDALLFLALLAILAAVFFRAAFHPIFEWDGWAIWDLKARAFFYQQGIVPFVNDLYYALSHLDYPLLYPLAGTFFYLAVGQTTSLVLLIPAMFYAALLGICYANTRRYGGSRTLALLLTLCLALAPNILFWSQQFQAEVPLAYFVLAGLLLLFFYFREARWSWLLLSGVMAGLATQIRIEGLLLVAPALAALILKAFIARLPFLRQQAWQAAGLYAVPIVLACAPWFVFRRLIMPYTERSLLEDGLRLASNLTLLPKIIATLLAWMTQPTFQGGFFLILPMTFLLVIADWKSYIHEWSRRYWVAHTLALPVPYLLFLMAEPRWLEPVRLGRYLVVFTTACYGLLAIQTADLFRARLSPGWLIYAQRLLIGAVLGAALVLDAGADLWPGKLTTAPFTSRPVSLMWQVRDEARVMLDLSATQRLQWLDVQSGRPAYGRLIQVALAITPFTENVALWVQPDNRDDYLLQRSYYLLYPRKVFILRDLAEVTPDRLHAANIGTVIVYDREPQTGELSGQAVYQYEPRYSVIRVNVSEDSIRSAPKFSAAPVQFAAGLRLIGYQAVPALLDGPSFIILNWQNIRPIPNSYTAFVHIYSEDTFAAQHDSIPVLGQLPTSFWPPGSTVVDAHPLILNLGPQLNARFCVGMYDSTTLERLQIISAEGYDVRDNIACRPLAVP